MANDSKLISTVINSELLETLAHPLRQQILIFIEQEGKVGYKSLKLKFNIATGTLYHHLRVLKGLISQDGDKQYILTENGKQALDYLFQENNTPVANNYTSHAFSLPSWYFYLSIILFSVLSITLIYINPIKIFFHFIPIEINNSLSVILFFIIPILQKFFISSSTFHISIYTK